MGTVLCRRYLIEKPIGTGGSSTVFSALDRRRMYGPSGDAMVAVKVLLRQHRNEQTRIDRLIREFRYMQRLTHPRIARVFDLDCDDGVWFMTMELLQGESLGRYLRQRAEDGLTTDEALHILVQCAEALLCAHEHGVIHGDLKPGNVFIDTRGEAHLLDFGSVPEYDTGVGVVHDQFLTPAYASPQMLEGQPAEVRDDLFSLGCLAYEIFSGRHPFGLKSSIEARDEKLRLIWEPSIPARHFGVIARMLSWNREERPTSALEFVDSLNAAQSRAKAAFTRESRPSQPAPETPSAQEAAKPAASASAERSHTEHKPHRESRRHTTPEDLARAFAQFSGVVPDDWVSLDDPVASAPAPATPPQEAPAAESDQLRARWAKAIPPELIEPKAKAQVFRPAEPAKTEAAPDDVVDDTLDSVDVAPAERVPKKVSWRDRLTALSLRARVPKRVEPIVTESDVDADSTPTVPVSTSPAAAPQPSQPRPPSPMSGWMSAKWRHWRPAMARAVAPAAATTRPMALPANWAPAVHWEQEVRTSWRDLQLPTAPAPAPIVQFDARLLPEPRHAPVDVPAPAAPAVDTPPAIQTEPGAARARRALQEFLPSAEQRLRWRAAFDRGVATADANMRSAARSLAKSGASFRDVAAAWPHWRELRHSMASLSAQTSPHWREAMPVIAIAGLAFVALLLLQFSHDVRIVPGFAQREELADERLAALANAEVTLMMPQLAELQLPTLPAGSTAPVVPAAPGVISFQARRVYIAPGQQMAAINVLRQKSTAGAAPLSWSIAPGTAKPDVDYELPPSQMARFNDGQDVRTVFIPIKKSSSTRERRFTVRLRKTPGAPAFGQITETEVVIGGTSVESVASVN